MISHTGRYGLRILGFLAGHPGQWVQGTQIAEATGIPANYLSKILNQLRKRGLVLSQKGWGGGFMLPEEAAHRPILSVLDALEGPRAEGECLFGLARCDASNPCPLHGYWEKIQETYEAMLQAVTISDLAGARPAAAKRAGRPASVPKAGPRRGGSQ
jgi:Rrf2 family protein